MILFRLTLGLTLLFGANASFAQTTPAPPASEVLVFGDVKNPAIFTSRSAKTVTELLGPRAAGGLTCRTANARIVRVTPSGSKVVGAALVSEGQPCDQKVERGDILVLHDLDRLTTTSNKPSIVAIIVRGYTPLFVTPNPGATASDTLSDKQLSLSGREFNIIRTHPKAVPVPPGQDSELMHGDIVMVSSGSAVTPSNIQTVSQEAPVVPKLPPDPGPSAGPLLVPISQQTSELPADPVDDEPIPVAADYGTIDAGLPPVPPGMTQPVPQPQPSAIPPMEPATVSSGIPGSMQPPGTQDPLSIDPFSSPTSNMQPPAPAGAGPGLQPMNPGLPQPLNTAQAGISDAGFGVPGQPATGSYGSAMPGSQVPGETATAQSDPTASSLPLPSELDAVVQDNSSSATMWYIAGLGGALLVVLGAWAYGSRMMAEAPQVERSRYQRPVSKRPSADIKHPPVAKQTTPQPKPATPAMEKPAMPKIKPIAAASTPTTPQPKPVAPAAPAAVPPPAPAPSPMVAEASPQPVVPTTPVGPAPATMPPMAPEPVAPAVTSQPVAPQPEPATTPMPVSRRVDSFAPMSIPVSHPASPGLPAAPVPATPQVPVAQSAPPAPAMQKPEPIPVPDTSTTRLLDALINNSIPITEQPVQLPGNAEYYGDSNGPQHLRLDPPQTQLRGHHLNARAGQRQTTHSHNSYNQQ